MDTFIILLFIVHVTILLINISYHWTCAAYSLLQFYDLADRLTSGRDEVLKVFY